MAAKKKRPYRSAQSAEVSTSGARSTHWMTAGVLGLYVFASIISFVGLVAVGEWFLPAFLTWSVVGMADLAIIIYKFGEIKLRQDPRKAHLAYKAKIGVLSGTVVSSAGNVIHIIDLANPEPIQFWGSLVFAGLSPWAIYLAASVLTDILVKPKPKPAPKPVAVPEVKASRPRRPRTTTKPVEIPGVDEVQSLEAAGWQPFPTEQPGTFTVDRPVAQPLEEMKKW